MDAYDRERLVECYLEQEENIRVSERLWREYQLGRDLMLASVATDNLNLTVLTRYTAAVAFLGAVAIEQKETRPSRSAVFQLHDESGSCWSGPRVWY